MEAYFHALAQVAQSALAAGERYTATLEAEETDFVRMNRGRVRQPGTVTQRYLHVRLIRDTRHALHVLTLTGDLGVDSPAVRDVIAGLRSALPELADDPLLLLPTSVHSSRAIRSTPLTPSAEVVEEVLGAAGDLDLVGIYAAGPVWRGFANSEGQRNWHETTTFNLQWSLYHRADKAVKASVSGTIDDAFTARIITPYLAEAKKVVAEKVVADADLADAGLIFGTGFAPFAGGPLHYLATRGG